jgi:tetratricopeptide (TPR) repeat protein
VGINTWHEARLLELGIDNVQSLATVDMCKLLLTTRFDTHQIVNWIDQAILHMKVGAKIDRFLEAKITTFHELHVALVKFSLTPMASENELQVCQYKESKQLDQNIAGILGVTTLAEIHFLCDYSNYPNYAYIQEYYTAIDEVARQRAQSGKQDVIGTIQEQFSIGGTLLAVAQDSDRGSIDLLNNLQDRENIEDEIQRLHSHLNNNPENSRLLTALGTRYYLIGKTEDALKAYNRAIELDVQLAEAYSNRSLIYIDQCDYEQAIRDNITAIRINRNYAGAFNNLGLAHRCQDNLLSAMESFEEALRLNPRLAVTYYNRGVIGNTIAKTEKEFQKAAYDFERAYLLGHDSPSLWSSWGLALCNLGEYRDAIDKLNQAIFLTKDEAALAYARRGYAYLQLGSEFYSKAGLDFEQAIQKNDSLAYAYANYGLLKAREGKDGEAIDLYNKAITLGENNYAIHCNLAAAYSRMRQWSEAISHYLKAIELGDEQATTRYNLAMAYNQSGKKAEAVEMLMQVKGLHKSPELESKVEALLERLTKEEE